MKYFDELKRTMNYLAENEKTVFIGQAVEVPGTAMSNTLKDINLKSLIDSYDKTGRMIYNLAKSWTTFSDGRRNPAS